MYYLKGYYLSYNTFVKIQTQSFIIKKSKSKKFKPKKFKLKKSKLKKLNTANK